MSGNFCRYARRRDRQRTSLERFQLRDLTQRFVAEMDHAARVVGEHASGLRQRNLVHVAREEWSADLLFELLDALADGWLRAADTLSGASKRPLFDNGQEMLELEEVH
jgi:hypothetical protein